MLILTPDRKKLLWVLFIGAERLAVLIGGWMASVLKIWIRLCMAHAFQQVPARQAQATAKAVRNTFDRKVADFVVCTKGLRVTAVVELDDSSHKGRAAEDAERQGLLERAGYTVLRFKHVPNAADLQSAIGKTNPAVQGAMTG